MNEIEEKCNSLKSVRQSFKIIVDTPREIVFCKKFGLLLSESVRFIIYAKSTWLLLQPIGS